MVVSMDTDESSVQVNSIVELEGQSFEEAKVTSEERKKLPATAFCGPNKTYPAHDQASILKSISTLVKIKPKGWKEILKCVCGRAKKAGVESKVCKTGKFMEAKEIKEAQPLVEWYLNKHADDITLK
jgi:hypothetical protein